MHRIITGAISYRVSPTVNIFRSLFEYRLNFIIFQTKQKPVIIFIIIITSSSLYNSSTKFWLIKLFKGIFHSNYSYTFIHNGHNNDKRLHLASHLDCSTNLHWSRNAYIFTRAFWLNWTSEREIDKERPFRHMLTGEFLILEHTQTHIHSQSVSLSLSLLITNKSWKYF